MIPSKISLLSLVFLIVTAINSIRNWPTTACFGGALIFYCLLAALLFLIPISLISAEFSSRYPTEGGVFHWVRHAFGEHAGVLAVWLQWINTMVWYPSMLLFIAGTAAHFIHPTLAKNPHFLTFFSLAIFWGLTLINFRGIQASVRINTYCGTMGTLFPMVCLILLGIGWWIYGKSNPISFALPISSLVNQGGVLISIMASFLGMELSGVYIHDMNNPQKNFPKAIAYSVAILLITLVLGSLSIALVMPQEQLCFIEGVMQTFTIFFHTLHLSWIIPMLALLICVGSFGSCINWLLSPAQGLLQVAQHRFLPPFFLVKNRHQVCVRVLLIQACVVSLLCFTFQFMPTANASYWFFLSLSTALYMLMYVILFFSALKLGRPTSPHGYQIPRGLRTLSCLMGLVGCTLTIVLGFIPPLHAAVKSPATYALCIGAGFVLMISPVWFLWHYHKRQQYYPLKKTHS